MGCAMWILAVVSAFILFPIGLIGTLLFVVGAIGGRVEFCRQCKAQGGMVPLNSPRAQQLVAGYQPPVAQTTAQGPRTVEITCPMCQVPTIHRVLSDDVVQCERCRNVVRTV